MALYAFDGTWNERDDNPLNCTNVVRFYDAYKQNAPDRINYYAVGVGGRWSILGKIAGGLWGAGWRDRVNHAYDYLCRSYIAGDTDIDIVGFSRGAAIALDFAHKVYRSGIVDPDTKRVVERHPEIRFLGLWDVVAAFGIANLGFFFSKLSFGHHLELPARGVQRCFHAMALDEQRTSFPVTRIDRGHEVWFRGTHADIGGGNGGTGLHNITLRWMYRKAKASGLPITDADIAVADARADASAPIIQKFFGPDRPVRESDRVHYSVDRARRAPGGRDTIPASCPSETPPDELAAQTVAEEIAALV